MRTSIVSLTLMTGLCILATNASAIVIQCPKTHSITCGAPAPVVGHQTPLYQTTCSSEGWNGYVQSVDENFVPEFTGDPVAGKDAQLNPACHYLKSGTNNDYVMFLNSSLQDKECKVTDDQKGFDCPNI